MLTGCAALPERKAPTDQHQNQQDKRFYVIAYRRNPNSDGGDLVGINAKGEITSIVSYTKIGFGNYDVYGNYLYYIDGQDDYVYKIDLSNNEYTPEKLFHVEVNWNMLAGEDKVYVSGLVENQPEKTSFQMFEYDLSDGSKKLITDDTHNTEFLCTATNQLFYRRFSRDLYAVNLDNYSETKILDRARIVYGNKDYLYLAQEEYSPEGSIISESEHYYVYELSTGKIEPSSSNLEMAVDYNNSVIHVEETRIMRSSYAGDTELLYDFNNSAEIVFAVALLKDKLLVVAHTVMPSMDGPEGEELYYVLDINTKQVEQLKENYSFLNVRDFCMLSYS